MTEARLAEIEARANAATPGKWYQAAFDLAGTVCRVDEAAERWVVVAQCVCTSDAAFIAACRADVPDMAAEIRRLQDENLRLKMAHTAEGSQLP